MLKFCDSILKKFCIFFKCPCEWIVLTAASIEYFLEGLECEGVEFYFNEYEFESFWDWFIVTWVIMFIMIIMVTIVIMLIMINMAFIVILVIIVSERKKMLLFTIWKSSRGKESKV
jgi:hypothetical protein